MQAGLKADERVETAATRATDGGRPEGHELLEARRGVAGAAADHEAAKTPRCTAFSG
jgi:hypothetical protein